MRFFLLEGGGHRIGHAASVAQRHLDPRHPEVPGDLRDVTVQRDERFPSREYLDVAPDEPDDTDSERLAHRLFGGEARRVVGPRVREAVAVGALLRAEQALVGARQVLEQPADAGGLGDVDAEAEERPPGGMAGNPPIIRP